MKKKSPGTVLVIVLLILTVALTLVPLMIMFTMTESKWSVKETKNTRAFHLAEAAAERGYLALTQSTLTWNNVMLGQALSGYRADKDYTDLEGGDYAIWIGSTSNLQEALVVGIGRDSGKKEVRSLAIVYSRNTFGNVAIEANNGVSITGNNYKVEWGAIMTPKSITANGADYPQFWSATSIDLDTSTPSSAPPNCDSPNCCQWHSYVTNLPPMPTIDFDFYKSSAIAAGTGPCGSYYSAVSRTLPTCVDTTQNVYYTEGDLSVGNNNHIIGDVITLGSLNLPSGNYGNGNEAISVPRQAWKQYCNNWSHYQTFDGAAAGSWPGINNSYQSAASLTYSITKSFVHGLVYVGGDVNQSGGGGSGDIVGAVLVNGSVNLGANSQARIFYNSTVASSMHTSTIVLGRTSWLDGNYAFPFP